MSNEIRGFLNEQGLVFATGDTALKKGLLELLSRAEPPFSALFLGLIQRLWGQMQSLVEQQALLDREIEHIAKTDERCRRLQKIEGVGPITATALVASIGNARNFKNGRQLSAFLGLVPRQHSSGGASKLLGISKRGDGYLRKLLIHGARAAVQFAAK
ncbi:MAG: IS110 family transposase, partial [Bdellovibrionota bacterium]